MEHILAVLSGASGIYVYLLIVLLLLAGACGFPFPEDMVFLSAGYMAYKGVIDPKLAVLVGLLGILMGDSIIYYLGNKLGFKIFSLPVLRRVITKKSIGKAKKFLDKHGSKSVFIGKFIVGLRYSVFFASGMFAIGYKRFIISDMLASMISIPTLVSLAYFNGHRIDSILYQVKKVEYEILGVFVLLLVVFGIRAYLKKLKTGKIEVD